MIEEIRCPLPGGGRGDTALFLAAQGGHVAVMEKLVEACADPHWRDSAGRSPRDLAEALNETAAQQYLEFITGSEEIR